MVSGKQSGPKLRQSNSAKSLKNPNRIPLGNSRAKTKKKKKENTTTATKPERSQLKNGDDGSLHHMPNFPPAQQLQVFLDRFQTAHRFELSSLELEEIPGSCIVELTQSLHRDIGNFSKHIKGIFGNSWKEVLCEGQLVEGKIDAGSPAVLVISTSALRSLELLRGLHSLTRDCRAAKLFAKHMKVKEQVNLLKNRVNVASGTPSRIKKLIDMDAFGLSRLSVLVLDMQTDAKGYSLFTLPQVSWEFWDLYKTHFHQRLLQGDLRLCFY